MISPAPFADLLILHSFLFLVNLFFDFFSPLSGFSHPSLERVLNLPYLSLFVKYYFYFFLDFLLNTKKGHQRGIQNKKRTGSLLFSHRSTIFAVMMLNFCVRYGYRCVHHAIATRSLLFKQFLSRITQNRIIVPSICSSPTFSLG